MTRAQAVRQAIGESGMYRQGSGWIVSTYDPDMQINRTSKQRPYAATRAALALWRVGRTLTLLGLDAEQGFRALARDTGEGTVRQRLDAILG